MSDIGCNIEFAKLSQIKISVLDTARSHTRLPGFTMNLQNQEITYRAPSREFDSYLKKFRVSADQTVAEGENPVIKTHLSMCPPFGCYSIPREEMVNFFEKYEDELKRGSTLGLSEIPIKHVELPVVIDIDLKWPLSSFDNNPQTLAECRRHTFQTIREVLKAYKAVYDEYFYFREPNDRKEAFWIVTQRDEPYLVENDDGKFIKDGFHIMNPAYRAFPELHAIMREKVVKNENLAKLFHDLNLSAPVQKIIDPDVVVKNGWLLFGSTKRNLAPYKLAYIFDDDLQEAQESDLNLSSMPRYLSYWRTTTKYAIPIPEIQTSFLKKKMITSSENEEDITLNAGEQDVDAIMDKPVSSADSKKVSKKEKDRQKKVRAVPVIDAINLEKVPGSYLKKIAQLLDLLSQRRGTEKSLWLEIGACLRNLARDHVEDDFYELWVSFSEKHKKFDRESCENEWQYVNPDKGADMATLKFWASQDSQRKYLNFKRNEIREFLMKCLNTTHVDVAQTLYLMFESQFVCSSIKQNQWYQFRRHRWNEIESGITLRKKISRELATEYNRFRNFCLRMAERSPDEDELENLEYDVSPADPEFDEFTSEEFLTMADLCSEIIVKLKNKGYKDAIMIEVKELFYDPHFEEKLNERHELLALENGVFDFEKRVFREGRPDDFITFSTKSFYIADYKDTEEYKEIMDFLKQIYLTDDMVHYVLKERAHTLHGDNPEERIFVWTGVGGNGKSKHRELTYVALGDYCIKFPVTLFTGRLASSNTPQPEVARARGARMVYVEEPEQNQRLNMGLMKGMSGGDPIVCRQLYGQAFEYVPQFIITLLCNDLPAVPPHDDGSWRRLTVSEHRARFVDNPTRENEHKKDPNLSRKIKTWKDVYVSILIDYYFIYTEEGLNPPREVTRFTEQFRKECDAYDEFITDTLVEVTDADEKDSESSYISLMSLYTSFKAWGEDNGIRGGKPMSFRDFKKYVSKKVIDPRLVRENKLYGYRKRSQDDSREASDAILSAAGIMT